MPKPQDGFRVLWWRGDGVIAPGAPRPAARLGEVAEVRAAMARAHADGALERVRACEVLPARSVPGSALERQEVRPARRPRTDLFRVGLRVVGVLVALAVVAALVWLCVQAVLVVVALVAAVVAWVKANWLLIAVVVAAVLLLLLLLASKTSSACGGLHCGGCRG